MKLGTDWLYIGLGLGAVYLVYKLSKPVTDIAEDVAGVTGGLSDTAQKVIGGLNDPLPDSNYSAADWALTPPIARLPLIVDTIGLGGPVDPKKFGVAAKDTGAAKIKKSTVVTPDYKSPEVLKTRDRSRDSFSSQSSGDVVANLKPGVKAYVSPFTGKAFTR